MIKNVLFKLLPTLREGLCVCVSVCEYFVASHYVLPQQTSVLSFPSVVHVCLHKLKAICLLLHCDNDNHAFVLS